MSDIKILIACTSPADHPESSILLPIQVGAARAAAPLPGMLRDDAGENISDKNPMYCELTAQYWAWKNLDADYYGFCHYRRYFNFSETSYKEDAWGNVSDGAIDAAACALYGLDDDAIRGCVEGWDVITTSRKDLRRMPEHFRSVLDQYEKAPQLHARDLHTILDIIDEKYPEYSSAAHRHCEGHVTSFCNMYILKKEIFREYCAWMFDVLAEFERRTDMSLYSREALRTPGHLSERLFGIFYLHLLEKDPELRVKQLQCVLFSDTKPQPMLEPAFPGDEVPVVFACNNAFVPIAAACIRSVAQHASPARRYDLVLLESDVTQENKALLTRMLAESPNISLRFFNAERLVNGYELHANAHISVETFFRFLIQDILPRCDKVLYLDCDLIARADVAELYDLDLGDNLLAAARDPDFLGQINGANPATAEYCKTGLPMKDPYHYFQAGVLLFNTREMRRAHSLREWLTFASHPYKYSDQDVLNLYCEGRVTYFPMQWNMLTDCDRYRVSHVIVYAPEDVLREYQEARKDPKIIHYAGFLKPWHRPDEDMAQYFWEAARRTPFYEQLLLRMADGDARRAAEDLDRQRGMHGLLRGVAGTPRRVVDRYYPKGSAGRERLKKIYHVFVPVKE